MSEADSLTKKGLKILRIALVLMTPPPPIDLSLIRSPMANKVKEKEQNDSDSAVRKLKLYFEVDLFSDKEKVVFLQRPVIQLFNLFINILAIFVKCLLLE